MENIKKDEWLHEEFGIKVDNRYLCIRKNEDRIVGQILNFSPRSNIAIKCEDGLHIIPYKEILELRPLPIEEERFKVGDHFEVDRDFIFGNLAFQDNMGINYIVSPTILRKGIKGTIYCIDNSYIYVDCKEGKFGIAKISL